MRGREHSMVSGMKRSAGGDIKMPRARGEGPPEGFPRHLLATEGDTSRAKLFASELLEAGARTRAQRDANAAIAQTELLPVYARMTGAEVAAGLKRAHISATALRPKLVCRRREFWHWAQRYLPDTPPFPVNADALLMWALHDVIYKGNKSSGLSDKISDLRRATKPLGEWGLTDAEEKMVRENNSFLRKTFPCETAPVPTLSLDQLERLYKHLKAGTCVEKRLCHALVALMVGLQARASELCGGALQAGDVTLHRYGILVDGVLNKTRKETLEPLARVAPRLPTIFSAHDPFFPVEDYLREDLDWYTSPPNPHTPIFRKLIKRPDGTSSLSALPMTREEGRELILKHLHLAGVAADPKLFDFNMHFGRAVGFNLLRNDIHLDRTLAAAAGGWKHKDVVEKHYHKHSPLALAVDIRLDLLKLAPLMNWTLT